MLSSTQRLPLCPSATQGAARDESSDTFQDASSTALLKGSFLTQHS